MLYTNYQGSNIFFQEDYNISVLTLYKSDMLTRQGPTLY